MPCDSIRRVRVAIRPLTENVFDIGQRDKSLLDAALKELGIGADSYSYNGEKLTIVARGRLALTVDQIKVGYSQQAVQATARKFGWRINAVKSKPDANQYVYNKR